MGSELDTYNAEMQYVRGGSKKCSKEIPKESNKSKHSLKIIIMIEVCPYVALFLQHLCMERRVFESQQLHIMTL